MVYAFNRSMLSIFLLLLGILGIGAVQASLFAEKINPTDVRVIKYTYAAEFKAASGEEILFGLINIRTKPFYISYEEKEFYTFSEYLANIKQTDWIKGLSPFDYVKEAQLKDFYEILVNEQTVEQHYRKETSVNGPISAHFYVNYQGNEYLANTASFSYYCPNNEDYCETPEINEKGIAALRKVELEFTQNKNKELSFIIFFNKDGTINDQASSMNGEQITLVKESGTINGKNIQEPKMQALYEVYNDAGAREAMKTVDAFKFAILDREKETEKFRLGKRYDEILYMVMKTTKITQPKPLPDDRVLPYIPPKIPDTVIVKVEPIKPVEPIRDQDADRRNPDQKAIVE